MNSSSPSHNVKPAKSSNDESDDENNEAEADVASMALVMNDSSAQSKSEVSLPFVSIASICFGMLAHSYLVISVFPYSGYMAISFIPSLNEDNSGSYAGLLASSFHLGRVFSAYAWGRAADIYGRKNVLLLSLSLSSFLSILFGLAPSFGLAFALRFSMGLANAIVGTNKTLVSDLANGNERLETKTMSVVLGMWAWGFLVAPFISGLLAEPVKQYPDFDWESHHVAKTLLQKFPFFLPNLLGSFLCLVAIALGHFFIQEPLTENNRRSIRFLVSDLMDQLRALFDCRKQYQVLPVLKAHASDISGSETDETRTNEDNLDTSRISIYALMSRPHTRARLMVYWGNAFVDPAVEELFPLFCISLKAGFGLPERNIGKILSTSGMMFGVVQYFISSYLYDRFGLYRSIQIAAVLCVPTTLMIPVSLLFNYADHQPGEVTTATFVYLCLVIMLNKAFFLLFFSNISVAINQTVPAKHRAALNGLSILGGSLAKGMGPTFAGLTATWSIALLDRFGSILMFGSVGLLSSFVAAASFVYIREISETTVELESIELIVTEETEGLEPRTEAEGRYFSASKLQQ